jgi:hypothetical protein
MASKMTGDIGNMSPHTGLKLFVASFPISYGKLSDRKNTLPRSYHFNELTPLARGFQPFADPGALNRSPSQGKGRHYSTPRDREIDT